MLIVVKCEILFIHMYSGTHNHFTYNSMVVGRLLVCVELRRWLSQELVVVSF